MNARKQILFTLLLSVAGGAGAFGFSRHDPTSGAVTARPTPRPLAWIKWTVGSVLVGGSSGGAAASLSSPMGSDDQLATEIDGRATLALRMSGLLSVAPRSALQVLPEEWEADRLGATRVRLLRGSGRADAVAEGNGFRVVLGEAAIELAPKGRALVSWQDPTQVAVSMLAEDAIVELADGRQIALSAREGLRLRNGLPLGDAVAMPAAPTIGAGTVKPSVTTRADGRARPVFRFAGEQGRIQVVVARDQELTEIVGEAEDDAAAVQMSSGLQPGNYFWSAARVDEVTHMPGEFSVGRPIEVVDGGGAVLPDAVPRERVVAAGALTRVFFTGATPPVLALDWPGVDEEGGYEVVVASDAAFKKVRQRKVVEESATGLETLPPGAWYWRVRGGAGAAVTGRILLKKVTGSASSAASWRIDEEFKVREIVFQRVVPAVQFSWKLDSRVARYRLKVARDAAFGDIVEQREAVSPPITIEAGSLPEGPLHWRVERLKPDGTVFFPGKVMEIQVRFDEANPDLELLEPSPGVKVGASVAARGLAPKDCAISVNGVGAQSDATGRFSVTAPVENSRLVVRCSRARERSYLVQGLR